MLGNVQFELQKLVDSYVSGLYIYIYMWGILQQLFDIVMNNTFLSFCY
jgi:hypothetical protein